MLNTPKAHGYLYVVVFENGTVKAGMSQDNPEGRISNHHAAGARFGISVHSSFQAAIYAPDIRAREKKMHLELLKISKLVHGREWFFCESIAEALNFASSHMLLVERESLAQRVEIPHPAKTAEASPAQQSIWAHMFFREFERQQAADFVHSLKPDVAVLLAIRIAEIDEIETLNSADCLSPAPELFSVIDQALDDFYADEDASSVGASENQWVTPEVARKILNAAFEHPEYFGKAFGLQKGLDASTDGGSACI